MDLSQSLLRSMFTFCRTGKLTKAVVTFFSWKFRYLPRCHAVDVNTWIIRKPNSSLLSKSFREKMHHPFWSVGRDLENNMSYVKKILDGRSNWIQWNKFMWKYHVWIWIGLSWRLSRLVQPGIRVWTSFNSDAELKMSRTKCIKFL